MGCRRSTQLLDFGNNSHCPTITRYQNLYRQFAQVGCSYKELLACNPKEYDGKGVKYTASSLVGKALTWWNSQIRTLSREVDVSMSWNDFKFMMIEEFCPGHAAYTDRFHELARLVPHLSTEPKTIKKAMQISGALTDEAVRNGLIKKRGNVGEPNKDKNSRDNNKRTMTEKVFLLQPANPDRNRRIRCLPKCTTCNSYHAPGGPCIEPSELGLRYEIEIASEQLVEINKVIRDCKLEIEGHVFDIDMIHFGHESFDVIIGIDWLSNHKAEIICHEKVVRIPLLDGKVLRVLEEKPEEKMRQLKSAKAKEKEQKEIVVMRDFPEVFPDDLSGLPPVRRNLSFELS
ncbi:reverse transcriptase domain-containing protein [Tanacetum coccineum]